MSGGVSLCKVLECRAWGVDEAGFFLLRLDGLNWTEEVWQPGQFVMLRPESWGVEMPWPRPFSIFQAQNGELSVFFQVAGRGTARLAGLRPGEKVRVTGPLGRGFAFAPGRSVLLLAGGMGLAPFWGYAGRYAAAGDLRLLFGHRMPLDCYPYAFVRDLIQAEHFMEKVSEDRAIFLHRAEEEMAEQARRGGLALACGPTPFLRAVQSWALRHGTETQISLENRMACGVGACLGCVVKALPEQAGRQGARHVPPPEFGRGLPVSSCRCGPVFWADTIDLTEAG